MKKWLRRTPALLLLLPLLFVTRALADTSGPRNGGTFADDATVGTRTWANPGGAQTSDNTYATTDASGAETIEDTHYLKGTNYGFTIPAGATINGITVGVERRSVFNVGNNITDGAVRIVKANVIGATDRSTATLWPTSDTYEDHGGASDLWGETWTATDINSSGFGAAVSAHMECGEFGACSLVIDNIRITVTYTPAAAGGAAPQQQVRIISVF